MVTLKDIVIGNRTPVLDPYAMINATVGLDGDVKLLGQPVGKEEIFAGHFYFLGIGNESEQILSYMLPPNRSEWIKKKNDPIKEGHAYTDKTSGKPYYDSMPIGMVVRREDNSPNVSILNLKAMPRNYRQLILSTYFGIMGVKNKLITKFYNESLTESEKTFPERVASTINQFNVVTKSHLADMLRLNEEGIRFAIDKYTKESISDVRLLDWNALPYLFNMDISNRGMVFNEQVGGLSTVQDIFVSKC